MSTVLQKYRGHRYILEVTDNFSKFGWTIPLKNKYAESITDAFFQIVKTSKRTPKIPETDHGMEYLGTIFNEF